MGKVERVGFWVHQDAKSGGYRLTHFRYVQGATESEKQTYGPLSQEELQDVVSALIDEALPGAMVLALGVQPTLGL